MKTKLLYSVFVILIISNSVTAKEKRNFNHKKSTANQAEKYTVSGYIKEQGSGENLFGVSVYIPELKVGTITNEYGFFSFTVPKGKHSVVFSYIGFTSQVKEIDLNADLEVFVNLIASSEALSEVVVIADQNVKESKVTQMSAVRLNPMDVQDLPALLGEKDVLKTLQLLPGIQGGSEGSSGFHVRGGTPDQNLIILDDAVVYNSNHLFGFFSVFNGDAVKSVEAFKGSFPARYGGRLSSVINIGMKDGNKEKLSGNINIGLVSSSVVLEGPINKGKTSFIMSGRRTYADLIIQPFLDKDENGGYFFTDLNFKIHHIFSSKDKLYWSNYYGKDKFYSRYLDATAKEKTNLAWGNITSTLRWNHQFSNKLFANTSLIFSNYEFKINIDNKDLKIDEYDDNYLFNTSSGIDDYSIKTDFDYYPNNKHSVKFGAIATRHNFTPQRVVIKDPYSGSINKTQELNSFEGAVYLEDDWKVTDKLNFSPGFRASYFNYKAENYLNFEPRIALSYNLRPDLAFKASYSKMNQYIHLLSSSGIGLPTDLWVSSTDNVKPQSSEQYAIGIAKDFQEKEYSFSAEAYYKKLDNVISYKEGASFLALDNLESGKNINWEENITTGQGWAYGTELLFRKQSGPLTGWLGYTLSWSERQFDELNLGKKFFDRYDRRHDISLVGIYKPSEKITLSGTWVLSTGNNYTLPNLQRLNNLGNFPINTNYNYYNGNEEFSSGRNNFRGETTHRLDLGIQFHKKKKNNKVRTWGISLYNAYSRQNPFIYTLDDKYYDYNDKNATLEKELTRTSVLMLIPSINYNLKF
ncbi:TonB-dependent receptor [Cellulophaga sp. Z1A5H]|uniref:TonB-dependent receptor n=1 Tax=Cellulophaga sp. Z1A5H TaxID=2687291 RepID=UPI0013FE0EBD|nr:TonB-dependent receptor [Cellulophaga sp. Z1A5H]